MNGSPGLLADAIIRGVRQNASSHSAEEMDRRFSSTMKHMIKEMVDEGHAPLFVSMSVWLAIVSYSEERLAQWPDAKPYRGPKYA